MFANYYPRKGGGWDLKSEPEAGGAFSTKTPVLRIQRDDGGVTYRTIFTPPEDGESELKWLDRHANAPYKGPATPVEIEDVDRMKEKRAAKIEEVVGDEFFALIQREIRGEDVAARKAELRAIDPQAEVAGAKSAADVRATWPTALNRRAAARK